MADPAAALPAASSFFWVLLTSAQAGKRGFCSCLETGATMWWNLFRYCGGVLPLVGPAAMMREALFLSGVPHDMDCSQGQVVVQSDSCHCSLVGVDLLVRAEDGACAQEASCKWGPAVAPLLVPGSCRRPLSRMCFGEISMTESPSCSGARAESRCWATQLTQCSRTWGRGGAWPSR